MLLSTEHKFIFIHIPKTAGSALHGALLPYATLPRRTLFRSALRRLPLIEDASRAHFRIHDTAQKIRSKLSGVVWEQYFSFAVVRNPFDHAISHYEYMKQYRNKGVAEKFEKFSFEEYLDYRLSSRGIFDRIFAKMPSQSYFVGASEGVIVSEVFKYENLDTGIATLSGKLGGVELNLKAENVTKSRRLKDKIDYYKSRNSVDLVLEIYADDFEQFSYEKRPVFE